ncbi:hypothetical protein K439DRAFT_1351182 [Ramaria rubella]|nr:hypothetical protein K439DRAFT_1351182 [Ramaria rubella]
MKALIERTELSNLHIRKLNILKQLRRDDSNVKDPISDNKEEDPLPVVSSYICSNNNNPTPPLNANLLSSNPDPSSASSLSNVPSISASPSTTALGKLPAPPLSPLLPSSTSNIPPSNPTPIDYYSLPPIFSLAATSKNELKLNVTAIPPSILQMAFNKMYIPLSMLKTSALNHICNNDNLKFKKVPFSNGAGKQSLDESQFPSESSLSILLFFQAYRNWLSDIDIISNPQLAVGWYEHHAEMLTDEDFDNSFAAWRNLDKQLHSQFMTTPFLVDPKKPAYLHMLECSRLTTAITSGKFCDDSDHHSFRSYSSGGSHCPAITPSASSPCFSPYDKDHPRTANSFSDSRKPAICLHCGASGHRAPACYAIHFSCPDFPIIIDWRDAHLVTKSNKHICLSFNVRGSCNSPPSHSHGEHSCSLCGDISHCATACSRD